MRINIRTTIHMPEIPEAVEVEGGTLGSLLTELFASVHFAGEVLDPKTGEVNLEGLFEIRLNDVPHNRLVEGLNTSLQDGDTVKISLILIGGG
jgi:molybdopterin converting factor small subunit